MANSADMPLGPIASPLDFTGDLGLGPYAIETTQRYAYGTRMITWEGKVFKYGHSLGTLYAGWGAFNGGELDVSDLINSVTPAAYVAGQREITVTIASTEGHASDGVIAKDELVGAHIVIEHSVDHGTEGRTVVGNTAVASGGGTTTLTLDWPLALAHAAGVPCELPFNPYRYLVGGGGEYASVMVVTNVYTTTGYNFWGQSWGPCWCVPGGSTRPGDTAYDRSVYFFSNGSVGGATHVTVENGYQLAGFSIDATESGTENMPMVMLQISI